MMSTLENYNKKNTNYGTPIDPNPRIRSHRKSPPLLIRFPLSKTVVNNATESIITTTVHKENKIFNESLPPIKRHFRFTGSKPIRYLSPVFDFHIKNLKPLFGSKKKVDQGLNTKLESSEAEFESHQAEGPYKISVITKNNFRTTQ